MQQFELAYAELISKILLEGVTKETRNGNTISIFGEQLKIDMSDSTFPILQGRKMFTKGIFGEFAALVRKPTCVQDFEEWGCNYWKQWADEDGTLTLDYGNAWFEGGQVEHLKHCLAYNPNDRRMIINAWRPDRLAELSLPCCHYCYQFYVENNTLHMVWIQRSVDTMIGLPSDIVLAAIWLIMLANEFGMSLGTITMQLGDCHIYEEHVESGACVKYLRNVNSGVLSAAPTFSLKAFKGTPFEQFVPTDIAILNYKSYDKINLELKS